MRHSRGFTLIELVIAMILVAILAIVAFPRTASRDSLTIKGSADQLASDIRYAQAMSMTRGTRFCVVITASDYELRTTGVGNACTVTREPNPAGFGTTQAIPLCTGCVATSFGGTLQFDGLGRPYTAPATLLAADGIVTIAGDTGPVTITISTVTGRVLVQ